MTKRLWSLLLYAVVISVALAVVVGATNRPADPRRDLANYGFSFKKTVADERNAPASPVSGSKAGSTIALGGDQVTVSPGYVVKNNNYMDFMSNHTLNRQTAVGGKTISFSYTFLPTSDYNVSRVYGYSAFDGNSGLAPILSQPLPMERGGFVSVAANPVTGAGMITGHNRPTSTDLIQTRTYYDQLPANGFWAMSEVPDALSKPATFGGSAAQVIWPGVAFLLNGSDTVTFNCSHSDDTPRNVLELFRKQGGFQNGTWTLCFADTIPAISGTVAVSRISKRVVCAYLLETATGVTKGNTEDQDVIFRVSSDAGLTGWGTPAVPIRYNATKNLPNVAGFRPLLEVSALIDKNDKIRLVWNATPWPADAYAVNFSAGMPCRILQFVEGTNPDPSIGTITTVNNAEWEPGLCTGGFNIMNVGKVSIGECDDRYYVFWEQFNDRPAGILNDCANMVGAGADWAANGEIYVSVSDNINGTLWDKARNITNSRTPGCDSAGFNGRCESDVYGSVAEIGINETGWNWGIPGAAAKVDLSGGAYAGGYSIPYGYYNDAIPGSAVQNQATHTAGKDMWIRFMCVPALPNPILNVSPASIKYPTYVKHGQAKAIPITMENSGNVTLNISSISSTMTQGPGTWLTLTHTAPYNINAGPGGSATMTVTLNGNTAINSPGTIVHLVGSVTYNSNSPAPLDVIDLPIDVVVADTVVGVIWDTIATTCTKLTVGTNGNMGNQGKGKVNLDYFLNGDCDTVDSFAGNTRIYLYDGSPWVLRKYGMVDSAYKASWSQFGDGFAQPHGFKPVVDKVAPIFTHAKTTVAGKYQSFTTGQFVTIDSLVAIEKTFYAPLTADSCHFIVQQMKIFPYKGTKVDSLAIGEAFDWDVPSDTGSGNSGGYDDARNLIWQRGAEIKPTKQCQPNNARWSGVAMVGMVTAAQLHTVNGFCANDTLMHSGYTAYNKDFIYPSNSFIPSQLWANTEPSGNASALGYNEDVHTVVTYKHKFTLAANDTIYVYTALATVQNGVLADLNGYIDRAKKWYGNNLRSLAGGGFCDCYCHGTRGNVDGDPGDVCDISDVFGMVDYLGASIPVTCAFDEADVTNDAVLDISDLFGLIDILTGAASPLPCP